jgi:hypothetical protein
MESSDVVQHHAHPESDGTTVLVAALVEPTCDLGEPPPVLDLPSLFGKDALALPSE